MPENYITLTDAQRKVKMIELHVETIAKLGEIKTVLGEIKEELVAIKQNTAGP